jgi:hypothetical protein
MNHPPVSKEYRVSRFYGKITLQIGESEKEEFLAISFVIK